MKYENQIRNQIFDLTYTTTKEVVLHEVGKGTENDRAHWTLISVPMMKIMVQVASGCTIQIQNNNKR